MEVVEKYRQFLLNSSNFITYSIDPIIAQKSAEYGSKMTKAV